MRIAKRVAWALAVLALMGMCPMAVAGSYSVRAVPPGNQADKDAWYFDLVVKPGQQQVLQAIVMNLGNEVIEVAVEAYTASTNCNGVIEFTRDAERDPSLKADFGAMLIPIEPVVSVPPEGEAIAEFMLSVPDEPFDGVIYGGLLFTKLGQDGQDGQGAMGIANIYRYAIGTRIRQNENPVEPAFELTGAKMEAGDMPALVLNLRNAAPVLARRMELRVDVYPQGGTEPAATFAQSGVEMAPGSAMAYRIDLMDGERLDAGEYRVAAELTFEERTWRFEAALNIP